MAHLRKQIRDNVVTAVTSLSTTGARVSASRAYPLTSANLPGLCVYVKEEEVSTETIEPPRTQLRTATLVIEGYAAATSSLDNTLEAISLEVEEALVASVTRGGLARDTRVIRIEAEYADDGDTPVGVIRIEAEIDYVVVENDLENAA